MIIYLFILHNAVENYLEYVCYMISNIAEMVLFKKNFRNFRIPINDPRLLKCKQRKNKGLIFMKCNSIATLQRKKS